MRSTKNRLLFLLSFIAFLSFSSIGFSQNSMSYVDLVGEWKIEFKESDRTMLLNIEQTMPLGLGRLNNAPVIINIRGEKINFICDRKTKSGKKKRVKFVGEMDGEQIKGKMYFSPKGGSEYVEWVAHNR